MTIFLKWDISKQHSEEVLSDISVGLQVGQFSIPNRELQLLKLSRL